MELLKNEKVFSLYYVYMMILFLARMLFFLNNSQIILVLTVVGTFAGIVLVFGNYKKILMNKSNILVILFLAFCISYFISICINSKYGIITNLRDLVWFVIQYFLFVVIKSSRDDKRVRIEFQLGLRIFTYTTCIFGIMSIALLYLQMGGDGQFGRWGIYAERLYGVYGSPNYGALVASISLVMSLYILFVKKTKKLENALSVVNVIVEILYIIYSNSLSGALCALVGIVVFAIILCVSGFNNKQNKRNFFIVMFILFVLLGCRKQVNSVSEVIFSSYSVNEENVQKKVTLIRHDTPENGYPIGNGRFHNWGVALFKAWPDYFAFGTTMRGYDTVVKKYDDTFNAQLSSDFTLENDFVSLAVCTGIIGLMLMLAFIILSIIRIIKLIIYMKKQNKTCDLRDDSIYITVIAIVGSAMFLLDGIVFVNALHAFVFWNCLGVLNNRINSYSKENI